MPKIFLGESFSVSFNSAIKKFWKGEGREYLDFASKFLSHCNEIFHWRTLWSFRKVLLSKNFLGESFSVSFISAIKKMWKGGKGSIAILLRSFCLTVTKFFIGEHFGVSENSFIEKFHA